MPSRQASFYGLYERSLERGEIPIAVSCNGPQLFQDRPLSAGDALSGKDCLDAIFDSSIRSQDVGSALSPPHEDNLRFMPAKNKIVEIDHVFPTTIPVHAILVKPTYSEAVVTGTMIKGHLRRRSIPVSASWRETRWWVAVPREPKTM
jgi:hypothetical protein